MKPVLQLVFCLFLFFSCSKEKEPLDYDLPDWSARKVRIEKLDSLKTGETYLPVYAQIYELSGERKVDLTATISIRNTDVTDTVYLKRIDYYNTAGSLIRHYLDAPIFVKPAETIEIIIKGSDNDGGTGANFIFEWFAPKNTSNPYFESVMISTSGQQGISFTCRGVELNK